MFIEGHEGKGRQGGRGQMTYLIEPKVAMPPRARDGGKFPWRGMKVGDSFFVPAADAGPDGKVLYQSAANFRRYRKSEFKASIRKVKGGFRAWRIKL